MLLLWRKMKMRTVRTDGLLYYADDLVSNGCLVYSYAPDAKEPIVFAHYEHEHTLPHPIHYLNESRMCKLFVYLAGEFDFMDQNTVYHPACGDVIMARSHEQYTTCFYKQSHVDYYEIAFPMEFFERVTFPNPCRTPFFDREAEAGNLLVLPQGYGDRLIDKLQEIEWYIANRHAHVDLQSYALILQIMEIVHAGIAGEIEPGRSTHIPDKLRSAIDYIHANYLTMDGIGEVAEYCGVTNTYLSRIFKAALHCTPNEYLNNLRISYAKYLLDNGRTLTEACYMSGFSNYTYFITKFKLLSGVTPSKFQKRN